MPKVFLSYSSRETELATNIEKQLKSRGLEVWRDKTSLRAGERWPKVLGEAIAQSDAFLLLWSSQAASSDFVELEWNIALALKNQILPFRVDETELPASLRVIHALTINDTSQVADRVNEALRTQRPNNTEAARSVIKKLDGIKEREPKQVAAAAKAIFQQQGWDVDGSVYQASGNIYINNPAQIQSERKKPLSERWAVWIGIVVALMSAAAAVKQSFFSSPKPRQAVSLRVQVIDSITSTAVADASAVVLRGSEEISRGTSNVGGQVHLTFDFDPTLTQTPVKLSVRHAAYVGEEKILVLSDTLSDSNHRIELLPQVIAQCRRDSGSSVVIGHFRPAMPSATMDISPQIADALNYGLLPSLQQMRIPMDKQPAIIACNKVNPSAIADHQKFAKGLHADAFMSGYAAPSGGKVKLEMIISDQFAQLVPPARASNDNLDLNDPAAVTLDDSVREPILVGLIAGYEHTGNSVECVQATFVAESILQHLPDRIADARKRCQERLPHKGLL